MLTLRTLDTISLRDAVSLWNRGFANYIFPVHWDEQQLIRRWYKGQIQPSLSLVACEDESLLGFLNIAIRQLDQVRIGWNGGMGVELQARKRGVGRFLIQESFRVYQEQGVEMATLEVMDENLGALHLYEQMGYQKEVRMVEYKLIRPNDWRKEYEPFEESWTIKHVPVREVLQVSFFRKWVPWPLQIESLLDGECLLLQDESGEVIAYCLYRQTAEGITCFHLENQPSVTQTSYIQQRMIQYLVDVLEENGSFTWIHLEFEKLEWNVMEFGFEPTWKQWWMIKKFSNSKE